MLQVGGGGLAAGRGGTRRLVNSGRHTQHGQGGAHVTCLKKRRQQLNLCQTREGKSNICVTVASRL